MQIVMIKFFLENLSVLLNILSFCRQENPSLCNELAVVSALDAVRQVGYYYY